MKKLVPADLSEEFSKRSLFFAVVMIILIGAALRLIPHPANFSPITALALFGGAAFGAKRWHAAGLMIPLLALFISDCVLGFHALMPVVYSTFLIVGLIGIAMGPKPSTKQIAASSVFGSLLFFAVTNTAVWWSSGMYSRTGDGLAKCFVAALPFLKNQLAGDLFYSALLFGLAAFVAQPIVGALTRAYQVSLSSRKV